MAPSEHRLRIQVFSRWDEATLSCHSQCFESMSLHRRCVDCFKWAVGVLTDDTVQVSLPAAVSLLPEGREAQLDTHPLVSVRSGEITPFTDTQPSRYHVLVFTNTLLCTFPSQSAHPSQRGVGVSKLVVCYAGDF